jgi:hypothetical protein
MIAVAIPPDFCFDGSNCGSGLVWMPTTPQSNGRSRLMYADLAQQWRELAKQIELLERQQGRMVVLQLAYALGGTVIMR